MRDYPDATEQLRRLANRLVGAALERVPLRAAMLVGSAGRGDADFYSDLDLLLYVDELPAEATVTQIRNAVGGENPSRRGEPTEVFRSEEFDVDGIRTEVSFVTVARAEQRLDQLLDDVEQFNSPLQKVLSDLLEGLPLRGDDLIERWRARIRSYPEPMRRAMIERHWNFFPLWYYREAMAERDAELWRLDTLLDAAFNLLAVLAGLNRQYFTRFELKRTRALIAKMTLAPPHLADGSSRSSGSNPNRRLTNSGDSSTRHAHSLQPSYPISSSRSSSRPEHASSPGQPDTRASCRPRVLVEPLRQLDGATSIAHPPLPKGNRHRAVEVRLGADRACAALAGPRFNRFHDLRCESSPSTRAVLVRVTHRGTKRQPLARGISQTNVWHAVREKAARMDVSSPTGASADLYRAYERDLRALEDAFPAQPGQCGRCSGSGSTCVSTSSRARTRFRACGRSCARGICWTRWSGWTRRRRRGPSWTRSSRASRRRSGRASRRPGLGEDVRVLGAGVIGSGRELDGELVQLSAFTSADGGRGAFGRIARPSARR